MTKSLRGRWASERSSAPHARTSPRRLRPLLSLLAVMLLLAAACGDDGDDDGDAVPTITDDTATTVAEGGDLEARADRIVVRGDGVPEPWTPTGDPLDLDVDFDDRVDRCLGLEADTRPSAESEFTRGGLTILATTAVIRPDAEVAAREFEVLSSDAAAACIAQSFSNGAFRLPPETTVSNANATAASYPRVGDASVSYRIAASAAGPNGATPIVADVLFFYANDVRMMVLMVTDGAVDTVLVSNTAQVMADRAAPDQ